VTVIPQNATPRLQDGGRPIAVLEQGREPRHPGDGADSRGRVAREAHIAGSAGPPHPAPMVSMARRSRSISEDERSNLSYRLFLDAGIAMLRERAARVSGNRMSEFQSAARFVVGRDERK
jgi:hypothetical protein